MRMRGPYTDQEVIKGNLQVLPVTEKTSFELTMVKKGQASMARCHPPTSISATVPMAARKVSYTLFWHALQNPGVMSLADTVHTGRVTASVINGGRHAPALAPAFLPAVREGLTT
jgi:hypothetical protein